MNASWPKVGRGLKDSSKEYVVLFLDAQMLNGAGIPTKLGDFEWVNILYMEHMGWM